MTEWCCRLQTIGRISTHRNKLQLLFKTNIWTNNTISAQRKHYALSRKQR